MKISMENLYVDIGAQRIKTSISLMLIPIADRQIVHLGCEQRGSHFLHSAQGESINCKPINIACVSNVVRLSTIFLS